jgi:tetratricopeptide (TPR) repeat protein
MIIDFGVSKAVSQPLTERTLFTEQGQFVGTPEYMSPEQAGTMIEDVDTRADIYSLGVVLYELLTGVLPFGRDELEKAGLAEIQKIIRETDPPHPSTRLSGLGEAATQIAKRRGTGVAALARRLHEELEWIPLMAMRKEPDRRYKTASELADDIRNYLEGDPLIAGPESVFYRTKKFVRRNRMLVTFVAVVLFALVAGIVASTILAIGQARARSEAERQAKIAQAVGEFLNNDLLGSVDPARARGQEVTVREVLDAASEKIKDQFKDEPLVEASIRMTLGGTYLGLGEYKKAERMLQKASDIRRRVLGEVNADTLTSMNNLALLYVKQGRYDVAEPLHRKARDISKLLFGDEHPDTLISMNNLAALFERQGRYREAEPLYHEAWKISSRVLGDENPNTLSFANNLALLYQLLGRYDKAEQLCLKTVQISRHLFGDKYPKTLIYRCNLAMLYYHQERYDEAERLCDEVLKIKKRVFGEKHHSTLLSMGHLARIYYRQERYDEAEPLFRETLEIWKQVRGDNHPDILISMNDLGRLYVALHRYDKAKQLLVEALETSRQHLGEDHPTTLQSKDDLGAFYKEQGQYREAESRLLEAAKGRIRKLGEKHPRTRESVEKLVEVYEAWGKPERADEWRAKLP